MEQGELDLLCHVRTAERITVFPVIAPCAWTGNYGDFSQAEFLFRDSFRFREELLSQSLVLHFCWCILIDGSLLPVNVEFADD